MGRLLLELGNNEIISAEIAVKIRSYIASKNPALSQFMRAHIFADAVNRIVDSKITGFNEEHAKTLKDFLFREIAIKSTFSIDCADVFKAAVKLKEMSYVFFMQLNQWLSAVLKKDIVRESLFDLVIQAQSIMDSRPDDDISDILDSAEQSTGGLKYVQQEHDLTALTVDADEAIDEEGYDFGESIREYIRPQSKTHEYSPDETALKKAGLLEIIKKTILFTEPKRVLVTSAFAAAVLSLMLITGNITDAATKDNNANISGLFPINGSSYSAVLDISRDTIDKGISITKTGARKMRATAYDLSVESCGKRPGHPQYGITSSGTKATVGRTVAVDPEVIPLGSRVFIIFPQEYSELDGIYIAEDTGLLIKGEAIDIFFGEDKSDKRDIYKSAMKFGVKYVDVSVLD